MRIGIVGAGRVGLSLGKYFSETDGVTISGYYSRTLQSAQEGAIFTDSTVFTSLHDILNMSDTLLVTTPDAEIISVWDCIIKECATNQYQHKIVCHCSGSLSSEIFSEHTKYQISVCSMHPMYAFYHKYESYRQLHNAFFTLEGDDEAVSTMKKLLGAMGNSYAVIDSAAKTKYHCAASMASNQVNALMSYCLKMLCECGFTEESARHMLAPLAIENVKNIMTNGPGPALTGPVERNDINTVRSHLSCLDGDLKKIYTLLGQEQIRLAQEKYPDRKMSVMWDLMKYRNESEEL